LYLLHLSTLSISKPLALDSTLGIEFTYKDYALVQEIHSMGSEVLKLLVLSLCPSIYGHELVKAGLILGQFGGSTRNTASALSVRGDPHILVVGDPGLGKSQVLTAACATAPRGVFVTGNTSTAAGLTVSLTKEAGNDSALETEALVLADQGCCCIDEFDKMSGQHAALLEAMEQQCISVAKAGVVCTLPPRTAILAAASTVGGHYNRAKTVAENLKLGPALLSRFDLVSILIDRPDMEQDERLSEHVMNLHSRPRVGPGPSKVNTSFQGSSSSSSLLTRTQGTGQLVDRLISRPGDDMEPVPTVLLRKYITYARRYVHPRLGNDAKRVLQDFYMQLRAIPQGESTPVTTRQLESLIRLTEARARLELREEATQQDALEIMRTSMVDTFTDNIGVLDFSRSQMGSGMSTTIGAAKKFVQVLQRQKDRDQRSVFSVYKLREVAGRAGIKVPSFMDFLDSLNQQGYFLKKSNRDYQLLAVDY
jgi:DNA helicase MCM8